jgi:peptide/nickel transport system substrate-binding protein
MDYWCDPEFDKLYAQQHAELDPAKRQEIVKQMQAIHYDAAPSIDFWYPENLEAYRSDKFKDLTKMPEDGGVLNGQSGYYALLKAQPVGADSKNASDSSGGGMGAGGWVAIAVALLAALGGGAWLARRRGSTADDRE